MTASISLHWLCNERNNRRFLKCLIRADRRQVTYSKCRKCRIIFYVVRGRGRIRRGYQGQRIGGVGCSPEGGSPTETRQLYRGPSSGTGSTVAPR